MPKSLIRHELIPQIEKVLKDSSQQKPVHWSEFQKRFVLEGKICTNEELVAAMNTLLMPHGNVSGINHNFFIGIPQ